MIGILLLVGGLACLGWVAYQYFGTNVVSQRAFTSEKDSLRAKWQQQKASAAVPTTGEDQSKKSKSSRSTSADRSSSGNESEPGDQSDSSGASQQEQGSTSVVPGDAIGLLRIPAFGSDYEIPILAGTDLDTLARGVGHYASTAMPGEKGNFAVAGHRVTHGQPFARLLDLNRGDEVVVETAAAVFTYVIDQPPRDLTVNDTDNWVLDPVPGKPDATPTQPLLTLTTCQDLFQSPDRSIAFAHLASTKNKS